MITLRRLGLTAVSLFERKLIPCNMFYLRKKSPKCVIRWDYVAPAVRAYTTVSKMLTILSLKISGTIIISYRCSWHIQSSRHFRYRKRRSWQMSCFCLLRARQVDAVWRMTCLVWTKHYVTYLPEKFASSHARLNSWNYSQMLSMYLRVYCFSTASRFVCTATHSGRPGPGVSCADSKLA